MMHPTSGHPQTAQAAVAQNEREWAGQSRFLAIITLTHPVAALIFGGSVVPLALIAGQGVLDVTVVVPLALAMLFALAAIGVANEIYDIELDRAAKSWRALPAGKVSIRGATALAAVCCLLALLLSAMVSLESMLLLMPGIGLGVWYSARLKRTAHSWIAYALAYPSLPVWVWIALGEFQRSLLAIYLAGFPFVMAVHLCNQLRDFDTDRAFGIRGLTHVLGKEKATRLCFSFLLLAPIPLLTSGAAGAGPGAAAFLISSAVIHWILTVPCILRYRRQPGPEVFWAIFKRVQFSGPLLMAGWLLGYY